MPRAWERKASPACLGGMGKGLDDSKVERAEDGKGSTFGTSYTCVCAVFAHVWVLMYVYVHAWGDLGLMSKVICNDFFHLHLVHKISQRNPELAYVCVRVHVRAHA